MAGKSIDDAFAAIINDWQSIAAKTVNDAAKGIQRDILKEAKSCLQDYYANYSPEMYKRTHYLKNAITPIFRNKSTSKYFLIEVGVGYDPQKLKNHYKSHSRFHQEGDTWLIVPSTANWEYGTYLLEDLPSGSDYGKPEPWWILNNYLEGIHPWAKNDTRSTDSLMKDFIDQKIQARIDEYMNKAVTNIVIDTLKKMVVK